MKYMRSLIFVVFTRPAVIRHFVQLMRKFKYRRSLECPITRNACRLIQPYYFKAAGKNL
jgi:hypothetical protein